jgi:5'-deoxynucleotidase YfbR-like HD superfamily hydrolase
MKPSIKLGRTPYWFNGERFTVGNRPSAPDLDANERRDLLRHLCGKASHLARWQGEENDAGNVVSVYDHSLLVAFLAYEIARKRLGEDSQDLRYYLIGGLGHDLGETLGLGDIAGPFLRAWPELGKRCRDHQFVIDQMMQIDTNTRFIKDADHLAAAIERRVFFGDFTRDCESPGMDDLAAEVFGERSSYILPAERGDGYTATDMQRIIDCHEAEGATVIGPMEAILAGEEAWLGFMIFSETGFIEVTVYADNITRRVVE